MPRTCRFVGQAKQVGYSPVSEFPHPDSFRTCTSQDCPTPSYHPSTGLQKGNWTPGLRATVGKRMGSSSAGSEAEGKSNGSSLVSPSF